MKLKMGGLGIVIAIIVLSATYNIFLKTDQTIIEPDNPIEEFIEPFVAKILGEDPDTYDISLGTPEK